MCCSQNTLSVLKMNISKLCVSRDFSLHGAVGFKLPIFFFDDCFEIENICLHYYFVFCILVRTDNREFIKF